MRSFSLSALQAFNAQNTTEDVVVLVDIFPPDATDTLRMSSHPTQRLSVDPLRYGTIHQGVLYDFVFMSVLLPDDQDGLPGTTSLVFENVVSDIGQIVRATIEPASVHLTLVLASNPDVVEEKYSSFKTTRVKADATKVVVDISLASIANEPWPAHSMTATRFPGLFP